MLTEFVLTGILWLCLLSLFHTGLTANTCVPHLSAKDLFLHLHWSCTGLLPNATFRVEYRMQRSDLWSPVAHCDGISSQSCDLSEEISELGLYVLRLGVEEWHGHLQWRYLDCVFLDLVTFSAPSLSVWVEDHSRKDSNPYIVAEVKFPCAPEKLCKDMNPVMKQGCCPVWFPLFEVDVMVTLFNRQRPAERRSVTGFHPHQSDSDAVNDNSVTDVFETEFKGLDPGQYCVVANFTNYASSSPSSKPVCRELHAPPVDLWPVWLGTGLSILIFIPLVVAYLHRQNTHIPEDHLPKALAGLLEPVSSCPIPVVARGIPSAEDSPSLISLCSCEPQPDPNLNRDADLADLADLDPTITQLPSPSPGQHQYFSSSFLEPPTWATPFSNSRGRSVTRDPEVPQFPLFEQGSCWDSEGQRDWGPLPEEGLTFLMDSLRIPLSSVRLGMGEEMECVYLQEGEMVQPGCEIATCDSRVELYHSKMEGVRGIFIASETNLLQDVNETDG